MIPLEPESSPQSVCSTDTGLKALNTLRKDTTLGERMLNCTRIF